MFTFHFRLLISSSSENAMLFKNIISIVKMALMQIKRCYENWQNEKWQNEDSQNYYIERKLPE
jgi:hypothetical protein